MLGETTSVPPGPIGRLITVPVRTVWPLEDKDFTTWLAADQNLELLSEILQLGDLKVEGTEVAVGDFWIDILARDTHGSIVIIENQFGGTDHRHLGQIITYAAGQSGPICVVWVAEYFRNEHRAPIDWLNGNTFEGINFFAVEVEAGVPSHGAALSPRRKIFLSESAVTQ
jgi:hypothetical protein